MSERDIVFRWLACAARRIRLNERLEDGTRMCISLLALAIGYRAMGALIGVPPVMGALLPLFLVAAAAAVVYFVWRLIGRDLLLPPDRAGAAAEADARAGLHNELSSALWFAGGNASDDFVRLHLARAAKTIQRLELSRLFPPLVPRSLPVGLMLLAGAALVVALAPRSGLFPDAAQDANPLAQRNAGVVARQDAADGERVEPDQFAEERSEAAWLKVEKLARELRSGPHTEEIAQAIAARDAKTASRLLAAMRRGEAAQPASGAAARPETEQMSAQLAKGIVDRLQSLLNEGGGWSGQAAPNVAGDSTDRMTEDLTRELREEMSDAQPSRPGEMSPEEQALNTTLQAMSRNSTGGREVIRGEASPMQGLGRTSVGSGAMGRRVGVSSGGAGDGEQPRGNPDGNAEAEPVLGRKTMRLQLQMQTVKIDQPETELVDGNEESFYAATQAQAAKTQYEDIVAEQRGGAEQSTGDARLPLAYRDAARSYTVRQHRREVSEDQ